MRSSLPSVGAFGTGVGSCQRGRAIRWECFELSRSEPQQYEMNNVNSVNGISAFSAAGEERERILFAEAVRDGYVRCFILFSFISTVSDA